jgi:hypothetical protein
MGVETLRTKLRWLLRVKMELPEQGEPVPDELEDEIQRVIVKLTKRHADETEAGSNSPDSE